METIKQQWFQWVVIGLVITTLNLLFTRFLFSQQRDQLQQLTQAMAAKVLVLDESAVAAYLNQQGESDPAQQVAHVANLTTYLNSEGFLVLKGSASYTQPEDMKVPAIGIEKLAKLLSEKKLPIKTAQEYQHFRLDIDTWLNQQLAPATEKTGS